MSSTLNYLWGDVKRRPCLQGGAWPYGCPAQGCNLHPHHVGGQIMFAECSQRYDIVQFLSYICGGGFLTLIVVFIDSRKLHKNSCCHTLSNLDRGAHFSSQRTKKAWRGTCLLRPPERPRRLEGGR